MYIPPPRGHPARPVHLKLTPELKEIKISPIQGHAYIMQLQVMFIMKYPQDWFHYLGKVRVRERPVECF